MFRAAIPIFFAPAVAALVADAATVDASRAPILIVENHFETRHIYECYLKGTGYQIFFARSVTETRNVLGNVPVRAIVLDILLDGEDTWGLLAELKSSPQTQEIPVIVVTTVEQAQKGYGLGADEYAEKPIEKEWLLATLERITRRNPPRPSL